MAKEITGESVFDSMGLNKELEKLEKYWLDIARHTISVVISGLSFLTTSQPKNHSETELFEMVSKYFKSLLQDTKDLLNDIEETSLDEETSLNHRSLLQTCETLLITLETKVK